MATNRRYLQSYFPRDLLTALPWGVLTDAIERATDYTAVSRLVRSLKLVGTIQRVP